MTRLKQDDIHDIAASLNHYNEELKLMTGCSLKEIAIYAVGLDEEHLKEIDVRQPKVAVVPMTCGQGIINGFTESVASIVSYLGFQTVVTESPDAGGVAEAVECGAEVLFMADDDRFVAVNVKSGKAADNGEATGKGYVAGLERMCNGLKDKGVLILGAGPVGKGAARALIRYGARVAVYDIDPLASNQLVHDLETDEATVTVESDLNAALGQHFIIVDACPAANVIPVKNISAETKIAAPGIPLGVEMVGEKPFLAQILHDPLQIGVATMIFEALLK